MASTKETCNLWKNHQAIFSNYTKKQSLSKYISAVNCKYKISAATLLL